ncbi:MAG: hypothetical protein ACYC6C_11945 [Coriobacteriia bacterium]
MWMLLFYVAIAGAVGGVVNSLLTDNGFRLPKSEPAGNTTIYRPGWIGNVVVGLVAAVISWGLYGPLAAYYIATTGGLKVAATAEPVGLTLSTLVGAVLIGIGGARWLSSAVDEKVLRAAGAKAAESPESADLAQTFLLGQPVDALRMVEKL